jgi:hypothetical protein
MFVLSKYVLVASKVFIPDDSTLDVSATIAGGVS